jgi:arylsulfatase A-like enzyme
LKRTLLILAALLFAPVAGQRAAAAAKPNIIFILADDLAYAGLGCYGQKLIQTPHLDKLAAEGMRFTDFYSGNTVCVPSRVSLITGRHPGQASIRDNNTPPTKDLLGHLEDWPKELWPPKGVTLGQVLKRAGYKTAQFGKLEAGIPMAAGKMTELGWDEWVGFRGTGDAFQYYPVELWRNDQRLTFEANRPEEVRKPGIVGDKGVYSEEFFMQKMLRFIRENKERPFFVYFPTQVPHGRSPKDGDEIQLPDVGAYADREWTHLEKLYAAAITRLDSDVGRIVGLLKELNLDSQTIIIFTSDNGEENSYYKYTHRFEDAGPLRGKKRFLYEGGIRVPMIARWPGHIKASQVSRLAGANWDFLPTFAELAGVARPDQVDGISLVPTMLGHPDQQSPREYLYWEYHQGKQQAVRLGHWKGVRIGGTRESIELYDLDADFGETRNVAASHPDVVARINAIMQEARANSEFNKFWPLPERRQPQIKTDKWIFDQLEYGIR